MRFPPSIQNLINQFAQLPTVGPRTAERYVFYLLKKQPEEINRFAQALLDLKNKTTVCAQCFNISEDPICSICSDSKRQHNLLCVVADTRDLIVVESTRQYNGLYFVLGGLLNAIEGIKPEQLNIATLTERVKKDKITEIILALDSNLEGETTSMYLTKIIKPLGIKVCRLARGLPMGADLEYADEITLTNALKYRSEI